MLIGAKPQRITREAQGFLKGKGICAYEENHTYIIIYGYEGSPLLLPVIVCDWYLVAKVYRQYCSWSIVFDKKKKKQFIPLSFHLFDVTINNSSHLHEVFENLKVFNLKEVEPIKGFDPEGLSSEHLASMRYGNLFTRFCRWNRR